MCVEDERYFIEPVVVRKAMEGAVKIITKSTWQDCRFRLKAQKIEISASSFAVPLSPC